MKKTIVLFIIGFLCFGLSALIGTRIGADGMLIERGFIFIPLGYLFILFAIMSAVYQLIHNHVKKNVN